MYAAVPTMSATADTHVYTLNLAVEEQVTKASPQ